MCGKAAAVWNVPRTLYGVGAVVSAEAMKRWNAVPRHALDAAQLAVDEKYRPSLEAMLHVGREMAWSFHDQRGYADLTLEQLEANSKGIHGYYACAYARQALDKAGIWVVIKRGTKSENGAGTGSRTVLSTYDPKGLLTQTTVGQPHADCDQPQWDSPTQIVTNHNGTNAQPQWENRQPQWDNPSALSNQLNTTTAPLAAAPVVVSTKSRDDEYPPLPAWAVVAPSNENKEYAEPRGHWDVPRVDDKDPKLLQLRNALRADPRNHEVARLDKYAKDVVTWCADLTPQQMIDVVHVMADIEPRDRDKKRRYDVLCTAATALQIHLPTGDTQ